MNLDCGSVNLNVCSDFPKTLADIKEADLMKAVYHYPQGQSHKNTVASILYQSPEVEILQQSPDFAILRTCPGLFLHNVPSGDIELGSEPLWYILQWLNRTDEGFHRVQGDLLLRDIREGWEIEEIQSKEKDLDVAGRDDMGMFSEQCPISIGNNHDIFGAVTRPTSANENPDPDPRLLAKTEVQKNNFPKKLNVRHREHPEISRDSKKKVYREIGLQRRGRDNREGGGD